MVKEVTKMEYTEIEEDVGEYAKNIMFLKKILEEKAPEILAPPFTPLGVLSNLRVRFLWLKSISQIHRLDLDKRITHLNGLLNGLINSHSKKVNYLAEKEFEFYCEKYNRYMHGVDELEEEYGYALYLRDIIEAMLQTFPYLQDLPEYRLVQEGDDLLKKEIPRLAAKGYLWDSEEHPKEYWWQHLKKLAKTQVGEQTEEKEP